MTSPDEWTAVYRQRLHDDLRRAIAQASLDEASRQLANEYVGFEEHQLAWEVLKDNMVAPDPELAALRADLGWRLDVGGPGDIRRR